MKKIYKRRAAALAAGVLLCGVAAAESPQAIVSTNELRVTGLSPDGTKVVGYENSWENKGIYRSAVWTPANGSMEWLTTYIEDTPMLGGCFACINDAGMIGGSIKDPNAKVTYYDDYEGRDVTVYYRGGAIWQGEKVALLPTPVFGPNDYADENDGASVAAISADGLTAVGNIIVAWMPMAPVVWRYDAVSGAYDGEVLELPKSAERCVVSGMSADGSVIVGTANAETGEESTRQLPCIWKDGKPTLLYPEEIITSTWCETIAVSQNGRWVVFGFSATDIAELDLQTGEITKIPVPKTLTNVGIGGVDNFGNFVGQSLDSDKKFSNLYYSKANNVVSDLDYMNAQLAEPLEMPDGIQTAYLTAISADGETILGVKSDMYGSSQTAYWLHADIASIGMMASVEQLDAFTSAPDAITVTWRPNPNYDVDGAPETVRYNIYLDGDLALSIDKDAASTFRHTFQDCGEGLYFVSMTATYLKDGVEVESVQTEPLEVSVNSETQLPFFDDFEYSELDPFLWTRRWEGVPGEVMTWGTVAGDDYENMTSHTQAFSISVLPYSNRITSRWMDATRASKVYLSAYLKMSLLNFANQDLSHDFLDVEISCDGENWTKAVSLPATGVRPGNWDMLDADISALAAGKVFQLRLNSYGDGRAQIRWFMDLFKVGLEAEREAVPAVLAAYRDNGNMVHFASSAGTYEAGYVLNSNLLTDYNIGNQGKDFIAAIALGKEELGDFDGMWLRGATAFVYDDPSLGAEDTTVEVMVWEDGELVSANMVDKTYDRLASTFFPLDEPVRIDPKKEYKVGLGIYANGLKQAPIYYQCAEGQNVPGRSDLFSEDEGKTWQAVSEVLTGDSRHCIWSIRANITPEAATPVLEEADPDLLGFNVFRIDSGSPEGVKVNEGIIYAAAPRMLDWGAPADASYSIVAYSLNGDKTAPTYPVVAAVEAVGAEPALDLTYSDGRYTVGGADVRTVSVYDAAGRLVAIVRGNAVSSAILAPGVNILRVNTAAGPASLKLIKD